MRPEDRENKRYSNGIGNPIAREEQVMFSQLPPRGGDLLDVGCGIGTIGVELQRRGFTVTGIDFSKVAVQKAIKKGINARVCDVDQGLPFDNHSFDVIWAGDIVEHVFDPIGLLGEMHRVCRPSGSAFITIPNDLILEKRLPVLLKGKSPQSNIYRRFGQCKHHTFFSLELFEFMIEQAGFDWSLVSAMARIPFTSFEFMTSHRKLAEWFGLTVVIKATPKKSSNDN